MVERNNEIFGEEFQTDFFSEFIFVDNFLEIPSNGLPSNEMKEEIEKSENEEEITGNVQNFKLLSFISGIVFDDLVVEFDVFVVVLDDSLDKVDIDESRG